MKKIIVANWKMKLSYAESITLAKKYQANQLIKNAKSDIVVCPDFISVREVSKILSGKSLFLGAQDAATIDRGASTGEVSPADLKSIGVRYVILGHSERREQFGEDSSLVAAKVKAAIAEGLIPIVCIGESLVERKNGETRNYLQAEIKRLFKGLKLKSSDRFMIAYEPVWAISSVKSAKAMDPEEANFVQEFIKGVVAKIIKKKVPILYGGSVSSINAATYLKMKNIDGLLVGAASLDIAEFQKMC